MKRKKKKLRIRGLIRKSLFAAAFLAMYGGYLVEAYKGGTGWTAGRVMFAVGFLVAIVWVCVTAYSPKMGGGESKWK